MRSSWLVVVTFCAALGCGLIAGAFFCVFIVRDEGAGPVFRQRKALPR